MEGGRGPAITREKVLRGPARRDGKRQGRVGEERRAGEGHEKRGSERRERTRGNLGPATSLGR
jgi:hypothetical protein